jgi:hypothetical protein
MLMHGQVLLLAHPALETLVCLHPQRIAWPGKPGTRLGLGSSTTSSLTWHCLRLWHLLLCATLHGTSPCPTALCVVHLHRLTRHPLRPQLLQAQHHRSQPHLFVSDTSTSAQTTTALLVHSSHNVYVTPVAAVRGCWSVLGYLVDYARVYWDISKYGRLGSYVIPTCLISIGGFLHLKQCTPI